MKINQTRVGKSIELFIIRGEFKFHLVSKIEIVKDTKIYITLITAKDRVLKFYDDDKIEMVYRDNGKIYQWANLKGGTVTVDGQLLHELTETEEGQVYNRRNAFRVSLNLDITFTYADLEYQTLIYNSELADAIENQEFIHKSCMATIKDLSETGCAICSDVEIEQGCHMHFEFRTEYGAAEVFGEVVRISKAKESGYKYMYGLSFINTTNNLQKMIYAIQREQLKRRMS